MVFQWLVTRYLIVYKALPIRLTIGSSRPTPTPTPPPIPTMTHYPDALQHKANALALLCLFSGNSLSQTTDTMPIVLSDLDQFDEGRSYYGRVNQNNTVIYRIPTARPSLLLTAGEEIGKDDDVTENHN